MRAWWFLALLAGCGFSINGAVDAGGPTDVATDVASDSSIDARVDATPDAPPPPRTLNPATDWEVSSDNGTTWAAVVLPNTNWGCDNCTRLFRATVEGIPTDVSFSFAADNKARMRVNNTIVYDEYFIVGYCTDQPCCARCCDNAANCAAHMSAQKTLDASKLAAFTAGTNAIVWEVSQETGGSGFTTAMTVTY